MFVVAGVTGHVGSVVARELLAKGQSIKVIVRTAAKGEPWSKQGAEVAIGVLDDEAFLTVALKGADGFFVLLPPDFAAQDLFASQRKTGDAIAAAVKASGVPHVVMLSSTGADLPAGTGPIKGLHHLEKALRGTGTTLTAIRAGSFQENIASAIGAVRGAGIFPSFTPADLTMPMIATKDIGRLAAESLLAKPKSETIDLVGPSYSNRELAQRVGKALGKAVTVVEIPQAGWLGALLQAGVPHPMAEALTEMYGGFATGAVQLKGDRLVEGHTAIDEVIGALTA